MGAPLLPGFSLEQTFFGFSPSDRTQMHSVLFDILWYGEGRWDWNTIYNMPVFLRTFYIDKINKKHSEITERNKKQHSAAKTQTHTPPYQKK